MLRNIEQRFAPLQTRAEKEKENTVHERRKDERTTGHPKSSNATPTEHHEEIITVVY